MQHNEFEFSGDGGLQLWGQNWLPDGSARAVFGIVHGLGEHSGRYINLLEPLTQAGFELWSYDLRGHGRSPGQRGHIQHWSEYHNDLGQFLAHVRKAQPGKPVFLFGHSLGANIVAEYVIRETPELAGVILSGLAVDPVGVATPTLIMIARLLSRIWPTFTLASGLDSHAISRIPEAVEAYQQDPMVHDRSTVRFATEGLGAIDYIKANASRMDLPLLVVHGAEDRIVAVSGSQAFFDAVGSRDKELWILPDRFHEPHNDLGSVEYIDKLRAWL
ncbi:MAG: lysophospholipase, partial [Anaerolineales bacterium]